MKLTVAVFAVLACFAISCNAAMLPAGNDLGVAWRHQFQYFMTMNDSASIMAVTKVWTDMTKAWNMTNGGIMTCAFNGDLGLANVLYPGNKGRNADFAGRVDFTTQAALTAFWKFAYTQPTYLAMLTKYVKTLARVQYLAKTSLYAPGTYYRSTFEYTWNTTVSSDVVQAINVMWYTWAQTAPQKPKAYAGGADLGLASTLYKTTNWKFGGSITFYNLDDLKAFWKWLYAMPAYKMAMAGMSDASRIQYKAIY